MYYSWIQSCSGYFDEEYLYSNREGLLFKTLTYRLSKDREISLHEGDLFKFLMTATGRESIGKNGVEAIGRVVGFYCGVGSAVRDIMKLTNSQ
jgi:hypothetical protein